MPKLSIRLLGSLQVTLDHKPVTGFATDKVRALLAYLSVESDRPHRRDTLAGLLWAEHTQAKARQNLRTTLSRLRQAIGDEEGSSQAFFKAGRETLQFNMDSDCWLDTAEFSSLVKTNQKHRHRSRTNCLPCVQRMARMIELYRGCFLDQFFLQDSAAFEEWALLTREWIHREALDALFHLASYHELRGDYGRALEYGWRQVKLEPWREESHQHLMRLLVHDGQRSAALTQYQVCRQTLAEELGVEPAAKTKMLYQQIQAEEPLITAVPTHNLVSSPTPFVGRRAELDQLAERLANPECSLLTIVGAGGIGKSRLAQRAADEQRGLFKDGIFFAPLAAVGSPNLLAPVIGEALNISFQGKDDFQEHLLTQLANQELLLVLDGIEHLLDDIDLLVKILDRAPKVLLLVTSRERLNLQEEWVYVLEGLNYPAEIMDDEQLPLDKLLNYSAIELFLQRGRQTDHRFEISERDVPHVTHICQLVEGLPLGVELAAAWVTTRSCTQVAQAIERNLDALTTPLRNVPERQRSVRATFEYSWSLLSTDEQRIFGGLSVFRGGFSRAAAEQVVGASPIQLSALAQKSLLRKEHETRYSVHELLRQFAAEKLELSQEETRIHDAHGTYYAQFLHQRQDAAQKRQDRSALDEIGGEMGNLRAAWDWAVGQAKWEAVEQSYKGLQLYFLVRGPMQLGEAPLELAISALRGWLAEREAVDPQVRQLLPQLLSAQARLQNRQGNFDQATETAREAIDLAHQSGAAGVEAEGYIEWGEALWRQGKYQESRQQLELGLQRARTAQRAELEAESLRHTGNTFLMVGNFDQARPYYEQAVCICREIGDRINEAYALDNLACISTYLSRFTEAAATYQETLSIYREIGDQLNEASLLVNLGEVTRLSGDLGQAYASYQQSLVLFREIGARNGQAIALLTFGMFLGFLGDYDRAYSYCQQSLDIRRESGDRRGQAITLAGLGLLAHYRGDNQTALEHCRQAQTIAIELGDQLRQSRIATRIGHACLGLAQHAAEARQRNEHLGEAEKSYQRALQIRRDLGQTSLELEVQAGLARVSLEQGSLKQASRYAEEILEHLESWDGPGHGLEGATDPFRIFLTCYQVLAAAGDARARQILKKAYTLLQAQASQIEIDELRNSFLEKVVFNRKIINRFAES